MSNESSSNKEKINLRILFFATLKEIIGKSEIALEAQSGVTIREIKEQLLLLYPQLSEYVPIMLVSVNQKFAFDTDSINEHCEVAFFPPVSGGSMDNDVLVKVTDKELEFNTLISESIQLSTGAVVMFTGVIRGETNNTEHPITTGLEYEAYIPMAEAKMLQVADEIKNQWPTIQKIVVIQRIGYMDAGTPTIVVLCTAAHRNTGVFEAAKYGIDRVKEIVPIWKKEIGPDGESWIEGDYIPEKGD